MKRNRFMIALVFFVLAALACCAAAEEARQAEDRLILVNQWHPLPDGYTPEDLVTVSERAGDLLLYDDPGFQGVEEAVDALTGMLRTAVEEGVDDWKLSGAYRTVEDQRRIFEERVEKYLLDNPEMTREEAVEYTGFTVQTPGCSEHHTGLAFDLNVPGMAFIDTANFLWLEENCWDYGFIIRYPEEKEEITGISGEEWHIRYAGVAHAQAMREMDLCLEEYLDALNQLP